MSIGYNLYGRWQPKVAISCFAKILESDFYKVKILSIAECKDFFEHYLEGLLDTGLITPLRTFNSTNQNLNLAVSSWEKALIDGLSYRESLEVMSPQFPACVQQLLCLASDRSVLDQAVTDIIKVYSATEGEVSLLESMTRLISIYFSFPINGIICDGCFEKDFVKLLERYSLEQANEVILEQEGNSYFHQKYLGTKLVHIIEPCHSMVINVIHKKLKDSIKSGSMNLVGVDNTYFVEQIDIKRYEIKTNNQTVIISFR